MGTQVELQLAGEQVRALQDPTGGFFDSAGDFDRLLRHQAGGSSLLSSVDPYGETRLGHREMQKLITEIDLLHEQATPGPERRGLVRLRTLAVLCGDQHGQLLFIGD